MDKFANLAMEETDLIRQMLEEYVGGTMMMGSIAVGGAADTYLPVGLGLLRNLKEHYPEICAEEVDEAIKRAEGSIEPLG